jgi:hypothetical protein
LHDHGQQHRWSDSRRHDPIRDCVWHDWRDPTVDVWQRRASPGP